MNLTGAIVSFVVIWWLIFFMALPFGVQPPDEVEPGHEPGAPAKPRLWTKVLITTLLTCAIVYGLSELIASGIVQLRPTDIPQ